MDISVFTKPVPWKSVWYFITTLKWHADEFAILPFEMIIAIVGCILSLKTKISIIPLLVCAGCLGALTVFI